MKKQQFLLTGLLLLAFTFMGADHLQAQGREYGTAVGLRLGYPLSFTAKKFLNEDAAVEGYIGFRGFGTYSWVNISGAYQIHNPIDAVEGLQWYYGGGASVFFFNFDNNFIGDNSTNTSFGIQGYLGLDYTFADVPISVTADWIPTFFINGFGNGFSGGYGTLGVRYILN
jgi:hypothetical protein